MINNTNIQFDKKIKGLDNLNKTSKKNLEIEYRDKHYTSLVNYINNNTKNKVPKLKDKISDHIKNLEKLLQQENVKLQGEVVSLNDNMNKEINNQDVLDFKNDRERFCNFECNYVFSKCISY